MLSIKIKLLLLSFTKWKNKVEYGLIEFIHSTTIRILWLGDPITEFFVSVYR